MLKYVPCVFYAGFVKTKKHLDFSDAQLKNLRGRILRQTDLPYICFYCGEPASDVEHVIPRCFSGERTPKVWSCRECNLLAGSKLFESIEEKRFFIQNRLRNRYKKILKIPDWSEKEISELSGGLKTTVIAAVECKNWIERRLRWGVSVNALLVQKVLEECDIGRDFVAAVAEITTMRPSERRLYFCTEN